MMSSSCAALLLPLDSSAASAFLASVLRAEGYAPARGPARPRPHAFPGEWVELQLFGAPPLDGAEPLPGGPPPADRSLTVAVVQDTARAFELACALSRREPARVFSAWRRFRGLPPVCKVFWGGQPQWKDGDDHDHEVFFAVPQRPPAECRPPAPIAVPTSAMAIDEALGERIARLHATPGPGEGGLARVWIHRKSAFT
jgi:hypothetical protein